MRGTATVKVSSLAAALVLLAGSAVSAQISEPVATPPPNQVPDVITAVLRNDLAEPAINTIVDRTASFAHGEIGGRVGGKRESLLSFPPLRATSDVVLAARELAEQRSAPDLIVISGGDSQGTVGFAAAYPDTVFIDIDQPIPCVTIDGRADPSGTCEGGIAAIPFNYSAVGFDVDQAAYLAGVISAAGSRNDRLGIISGTLDCEDCNRYIQGYVRGAQSIKPDIDIELAFLADEGEELAFGDPTSAKTFASAFIDVFRPDVILPLAGKGSRGIIEAACAAGIRAVGTDIDVSATYPELAECILTSIVKDYEYAVRESIFAFANADLEREWRLGLRDGSVRVTDEWTRLAGLPVDLTERYTQAQQDILTGQVETCPTDCGSPFGPGIDEEVVTPDAPVERDDADASPVP